VVGRSPSSRSQVLIITIDLPPEVERNLLARPTAKGVSLTDFAHEILAREARAPSPTPPGSNAQNLYDLFTPVRGLLTDEEVDAYFSRTPSVEGMV
jgi:hypothetical protein